jgi:hypothetical protein
VDSPGGYAAAWWRMESFGTTSTQDCLFSTTTDLRSVKTQVAQLIKNALLVFSFSLGLCSFPIMYVCML